MEFDGATVHQNTVPYMESMIHIHIENRKIFLDKSLRALKIVYKPR